MTKYPKFEKIYLAINYAFGAAYALMGIAFIVAAIMLIVGCTGGWKMVQEKDLKFHAGQKVNVMSGFYQGCIGTIGGFRDSRREDESPTYLVELFCGDHKVEGYMALEEKTLGPQ